jgi:AcrR family transcriptional regulator
VTDGVRVRPKDRRATILATAAVWFHRRGYAGTSLEDIAGELGITAPAIYRHFRGKDALYTAALDANLTELEACLAASNDRDDAIRRLARVAIDHPTLGLLWSTDRRHRLVDPDGDRERRIVAAADALGDLLEDGRGAELGRLLARTVLAAVSSTGFYASSLEPDAQASELADVLETIARFHPAGPLVALPLATDEILDRPWTTPRSALLDACAKLVIRNGGYHAVTIEDIAAAAGVSSATVYQLFTGKADLFAAALRRVAHWLLASLQQTSASAATAREALDLAVASSLDFTARHLSWTSTLSDELPNLPPEHRAGPEAIVREYLGEWLALGVAVSGADAATAEVRLRAVLAVLDDRAAEAADRRVLSVSDTAALVRTLLEGDRGRRERPDLP